MTQKELSYVEDAINHENSIIDICTETVSNLEDENLISFMQEEIKKHQEIKEKLLNMIEVKSNG